MSLSLSVVIPAYNEEDNIALCLKNVSSVLKDLRLDYEIIVVNDGSRDKTGHIAKSFVKKIPHLRVVENKPNRGYGGSLRRGFAEAKKEFVAFVPADNQFDFSQIKLLLAVQKDTQADIVSGIRSRSSDPWYRSINRWGWNTLVRALFGYLATDIDCGFKLFRRSLLSQVNLNSNGAMVDTELFAGARARNFKVAEVPVTHLPRIAGKPTGANPAVILKAFKDLLSFWWRLKQEIMVEQGRAIFRWEAVAMIVILLLAAGSRLYRIGDYMTFLGDEGRDALIVRDIVTLQHFPLIGPGTSVGSMYLGPWYYYLIAPFLWLFNLSPIGPSIEVALFGVATVFLIWWIGRQWFGRSGALLVSALYALSPTVIIYSRSSWNPNVMPFFALLAVYGIWKVWRYGYWRWLVISAISLAFVLNSHYLGLLLVPFMGLYWLLSRKNRGWIRSTVLAVIALGLMLSPLVFFDLRHGWSNSQAVTKFFSQRETTVNLKVYKAVPNLYPIYSDFITSLIAAKNPAVGQVVALALLALVAFTLVLLRRQKNFKDLLFVVVWLLSGLIGLGLYKQHIYDHYYGFIFPAPFFLLGFIYSLFSSRRLTRFLALGLFVYLFVLNITRHPLLLSPNQQLARTREVANFITQLSSGQPFNLALLSKSNYDAGYRYFLTQVDAPYYTIHEQLTDQLFVICELPDCQPIGNPLWEIASFGWAKIDRQWEFPWGVKLYRLVHNPTGATP